MIESVTKGCTSAKEYIVQIILLGTSNNIGRWAHINVKLHFSVMPLHLSVEEVFVPSKDGLLLYTSDIPNPDTSNPNPAESESTPFFLNMNPNLNPTASNPNPDSNPVGHRRPQRAARRVCKWSDREILNPDSNLNPTLFFLAIESESGFLLSSSESKWSKSESSLKSSESGFGFAHHCYILTKATHNRLLGTRSGLQSFFISRGAVC